jgi:hypothetical protein
MAARIAILPDSLDELMAPSKEKHYGLLLTLADRKSGMSPLALRDFAEAERERRQKINAT